MKISVVVLTYNSGKYILDTLESAYKQNFSEEIELIISDDCSSDNTVRLCKDWLSKHKDRFSSVTILESECNSGVTANFNRACRAASGDWIKTIAGDDILADGCLQTLLDGAKNFGPECNFISSQALKFYDNKNLSNIHDLEIIDPVPDLQKIDIDCIWKNPMLWIPAPTFMYRKSLLEAIGYCPEIFRNMEDAPLIAMTLVSGYDIYILHKPVVFYRVHEESITSKELNNSLASERHCTVFMKIIRPHLNFTRKWNCFFAYLPLKINIWKKGKYTWMEKRARKYARYFQLPEQLCKK